MIHSLRIRGYKSLEDCTLDLAPLTVILGPNGGTRFEPFPWNPEELFFEKEVRRALSGAEDLAVEMR